MAFVGGYSHGFGQAFSHPRGIPYSSRLVVSDILILTSINAYNGLKRVIKNAWLHVMHGTLTIQYQSQMEKHTMLHQIDTARTILAQYADGPAFLDLALAGLSKSNLDLALNAESWSIRQIVHHLVDGDDIWKTCIKTALGNSDAVFSLQWYTAKPQLEWSESWAYARRGLETSLALFHANRRHIVDLLEHIPGAYERSVRFQLLEKPEMRITVFDVLELHVRHLKDHIKDIQAIRQAHGV